MKSAVWAHHDVHTLKERMWIVRRFSGDNRVFKLLFKGLTGQIYRWNQSKWRVHTLLLKNADKWTAVAIDGFRIEESEALSIRNTLCAGIDSTIRVAAGLLDRVEEDFSTPLVGDLIIRDWYAALHLGALLYSAATYRESGRTDIMAKLILVVTLNGHSAIYGHESSISNSEWQAILDSANPTSAVVGYIIQRLIQIFGPPNDLQAMLFHVRALPEIADSTYRRLETPSFSLIVDSWIYQAHNGLVGKQ